MKTRFNTYDIVCMVTELQRLLGMRVNQVYDIDNRTYVIRLQRSEEKSVLLLESGNRFHTTQFEWPKNVAPSGFTMKLRKHLKNKRLEKLSQIGVDRIVDLQFGSGEAAYHVILELYDRGNIVLTDCNWVILNVLRPHVEGDKIRFAVKEKYPLDRAKAQFEPPNAEALTEILAKSRPGDNLKKILNPNLEYGASLIDHVLLDNGLSGNMKIAKEPGKGFQLEIHLDKLVAAINQAERLVQAARAQVTKGYIIQKKETRPNPDGGDPDFLLTNQEFHPLLFNQHKDQPYVEHETFDRAVDEFYSALEGQKIDMKTVQVEREAFKKLENVRRDHEKRVSELSRVQSEDRRAAELIARNQPLVDQARMAVQAAIANQMSWNDIKELVKTAQDNADPVASCIKTLKLDTNHISLYLSDPYESGESRASEESGASDDERKERLEPMVVDIDLSLTAFSNARRYYDQKRNAAKKQQKTLESAGKALKSAERKTKQTLKEAHTISNITKARKTYWFEKFFWFISSDNYLVIGGRDQQQNELLVKRYMKPRDVYVHAEVAGASSVIVKVPGPPPPPRTLSEAGQAAVAYSVAWEAKVLTRAWWVHAYQVSKSAPTGEYLTTGSFMIRGKKNYLLPEHLQFGFSFMFRLEDSCIERHKDERKPIQVEDMSDVTSDVTSTKGVEEDQEIVVSDDEDDPSEEDKQTDKQLNTILEETTHIHIKDESPEDTKEIEKDGDTSIKEIDDRGEEGEDSDSDESSSGVFPDTHIKVDHGTGEVIMQMKTRTISEVSEPTEDVPLKFPPLPKKNNKKPAKNTKEQKKTDEKEKKDVPKRGQKGKMKKMKDKYKFQDDEDKYLMMELLQSQGRESRKAQKLAASKATSKSKQASRGPKIPAPAPALLEAEDAEGEPDADGDNELEPQGPDADTETLHQLTGQPTTEDELLFAVPVVAPYSALINYKYKVKLTPGTSKRGKAAKTAVQVFLRDKNASNREKDLLKAVKEENIARNFPGKVRLSAPQLHKGKK